MAITRNPKPMGTTAKLSQWLVTTAKLNPPLAITVKLIQLLVTTVKLSQWLATTARLNPPLATTVKLIQLLVTTARSIRLTATTPKHLSMGLMNRWAKRMLSQSVISRRSIRWAITAKTLVNRSATTDTDQRWLVMESRNWQKNIRAWPITVSRITRGTFVNLRSISTPVVRCQLTLMDLRMATSPAIRGRRRSIPHVIR